MARALLGKPREPAHAAEQVVGSPPVFHEHRAIFLGQLRQCSPSGLTLERPMTGELDCKSSGMVDVVRRARALMRIAQPP